MEMEVEKFNGVNLKTKCIHAMTDKQWTLCGYSPSNTKNAFEHKKKKVTCLKCLKLIEEFYINDKKYPQTNYERDEIILRHVVTFDENIHSDKILSKFPAVYDSWMDL